MLWRMRCACPPSFCNFSTVVTNLPFCIVRWSVYTACGFGLFIVRGFEALLLLLLLLFMNCIFHVLWSREVHAGFWRGDLRERGHLEDIGIDGWIILKWMFKMWDGGVDCIDLAQNRDRWRAVVNAVMSLRVHGIQGVSWLAEGLLASQKRLCSMDLLIRIKARRIRWRGK